MNTATRRLNSLSPVAYISAALALVTIGFLFTYRSETIGRSKRTGLLAATWNMAAINNNPFEYWITYDKDDSYDRLMGHVSNFMRNPQHGDVPVHQVFTDKMYDELELQMQKAGWSGLDAVREIWTNDYRGRNIISGFLKDDIIGKKRLTSMPDRVTNTISVGSQTYLRPTVINCYRGPSLDNVGVWWSAWIHFMFEVTIPSANSNGAASKHVYEMLQKIKHSKYPTLTEQEESISLPLQTVALAIFDAILVHSMNHLTHAEGGGGISWQHLRKEMCDSLNTRKNAISDSILSSHIYNQHDVIFLQEVSKTFLSIAQSGQGSDSVNAALMTPVRSSSGDATPSLTATSVKPTISQYFRVFAAKEALEGKTNRDQNSAILLKNHRYSQVHDVTAEVIQELQVTSAGKPVPIAEGDVFAISAWDSVLERKYLFVSFHGDTNGLATIPVLAAVHSYATTKRPDHRLVFGMDANTYETPESDQQGVAAFAEFYVSKALNSCYGKKPNPKNYTTFHARTFLQSQLNKAVALEERDTKGDKNPKDFIVFFDADFSVLWTRKDNTGRGMYIDNMIFPTLQFPSDHAITATLLLARDDGTSPALRSQ